MKQTKRTLFLLILTTASMLTPIPAHAWHPGHDEHASKHGGRVISIGDAHQHVEIVSRPGHQYDVYFSDSAQQELPAAKFSKVALLFTRPGTTQQTIQLHLSDDGEYWTGAGGPSETSAQTGVKITCTSQGAALSKDILLFAPPASDQHAHSHGRSAN